MFRRISVDYSLPILPTNSEKVERSFPNLLDDEAVKGMGTRVSIEEKSTQSSGRHRRCEHLDGRRRMLPPNRVKYC